MQNLHKTLFGQLPLLEDVGYVSSYDRLIPPKQLTHLLLGKPYCFAICLYLKT